MEISFESFSKEFQLGLKGEMTHWVSLGSDARGNITRLDHSLKNIEQKIESAKQEVEHLQQQQEAAQNELKKPFPQEQELAEKSARLAELNALLDMENQKGRKEVKHQKERKKELER